MSQPSPEAKQAAEQVFDEPVFDLERDGLEVDEFSKSQASVIEAMDSPVATFDMGLSRRIWKALARRFKDLAAASQEPGMQRRYEICAEICRSMPAKSCVADSLLVIFDLRERYRMAGRIHKYLDGTVARIMREITYKWIMAEFAGRQVG